MIVVVVQMGKTEAFLSSWNEIEHLVLVVRLIDLTESYSLPVTMPVVQMHRLLYMVI